jgi:hypothetical protein
VAADRDSSASDALVDRAFGACGDFVASGGRGQRPIARGGASECRFRVSHEAPRARLVEMLMGVN